VDKLSVLDIKNLRILVTGGAGFIGSELVKQLVERGADVFVIDNLVNGKKENLVGIDSATMQLFIGDIRNKELMSTLLNKVDIIFHLACLGVRHSIHSPRENHEVNATATLQLLATARSVGVKRFVYVSSSEIYGTARIVPMTEEHPAYPMTVYGSAKLAGDCYTRAFYETYDFPTVVIRPFNSYGPHCHHEGDSGEVIPKFLLRCLAGRPMIVFGDGDQTRDFTFVSDTARGIIEIGCAKETIGGTFNLGSGKEHSIKELAREVAKVLEVTEPRVDYIDSRPGDVLRLYADSSKIENLIGFKPIVSLNEGLLQLKKWYIGHGVDPNKLLEEEQVKNWKRK